MMTQTDMVDILEGIVALCPAQAGQITTDTAKWWHRVIGHLDLADVEQAVVRIARRSKFVSANEILEEVSKVRSRRTSGMLPAPAEDPDDEASYRAGLQGMIAMVADGRAVTPPPRLRVTRATRPAAVAPPEGYRDALPPRRPEARKALPEAPKSPYDKATLARYEEASAYLMGLPDYGVAAMTHVAEQAEAQGETLDPVPQAIAAAEWAHEAFREAAS